MAQRSDLGDILRSHGIADSSLQGLPGARGYFLEVPGAEVVARWSALRNIFDETGYWPVVLGGDAELSRHTEALEILPATVSTLRKLREKLAHKLSEDAKEGTRAFLNGHSTSLVNTFL